MTNKNQASERQAAEKQAQEAQERLADAQQQAAEAQQGLQATVTQNLPPIKVRVLPGNGITEKGVGYSEGEVVELDGPTAIAMVQAGHAEIAGGN